MKSPRKSLLLLVFLVVLTASAWFFSRPRAEPLFDVPTWGGRPHANHGAWGAYWLGGSVGQVVVAPASGVLTSNAWFPFDGPRRPCSGRPRVLSLKRGDGIILFWMQGADWEVSDGAVDRGARLGTLAACEDGRTRLTLYAAAIYDDRVEPPLAWDWAWSRPLDIVTEPRNSIARSGDLLLLLLGHGRPRSEPAGLMPGPGQEDE